MAVIATEKLTRRYGSRLAVDQLDLQVRAGTLYGFLGPNGAGKTSAIRVLLGFLRASAGRARVFGLDCWKDSARIKADVGYLPGDLRLYSWMTCVSALSLVGHVRGRDVRAHGMELAILFDLEPDVPVRKMSRGMRQKLGLILAMAHRPRLLVLDEPSASLDPLIQGHLYRRLRELTASGVTVFFSSHTLDEVERLCDRVAILRKGRLIAEESLDDLRARAKRRVTITWETPAEAHSIDVPSFLGHLSHDGRVWTADLEGPVTDLVRWCANHPIDDLSIERPDLASLFQQYYVDSGETQ